MIANDKPLLVKYEKTTIYFPFPALRETEFRGEFPISADLPQAPTFAN